jgi:signal transduction histidine kinase
MVAFSLLAIGIGTAALTGLSSARNDVVSHLDPGAFDAAQLYTALLDQETGIRGYALSANPAFQGPYHQGVAEQRTALSRLHAELRGLPVAQADLAELSRRIDRWRASYAVPTIAQITARGKPLVGANIQRGKTAFDSLRQPLNDLQSYLAERRAHALVILRQSSRNLDAACIAIAIGLLLAVVALTVGLRRSALRPLERLAGDARLVADGEFSHEVGRSGPRELRNLGADMDEMRLRILQELSALQAAHASLETRTEDLQRSNAELEQFAYVASHDLQEPLRKVASFCQLLQRRYGGELDERADQYIEFAVDGAKRMQVLINDLLAFSRVGRSSGNMVLVSCNDALAEAKSNLARGIRESRAVIKSADLPQVLGEPALLTAVFQNLLSNGIKFRGDEPPQVTVAVHRDGEFWEFSVTDNGIGIDDEYADRIFVIFQRLHDRSAYTGTGIGLAMCRKIIEFHGGRIWLEPGRATGSQFRFTLPAQPEPAEPSPAQSPPAPSPPAQLEESQDDE